MDGNLRELASREVLSALGAGQRDFAHCYVEDSTCFDAMDLTGVSFEASFVFDASFRHAKLRGACFRDANVKCADFTGADLRDADFRDAAIDGAVFSGADLRGAQFEGASAYGGRLSAGGVPD